MVTRDHTGVRFGALLVVASLMAPMALFAQDECQFEGSPGASDAAQALEAITPESTDEERTAAYQAAFDALGSELKGDNAIALLFGARAEAGLEHFDEALALLERFAEAADPECQHYGTDQGYNIWVGLYNTAVEAYSLGENDSALGAFLLANRFHPDLRAFSNAALLYSEMGDSQAAIETYQAALTADIADPDPEQLRNTIRGLGDLLSQEGRGDEAMAAYEGFLTGHPDDVVIRIRYAGLMADNDQAEDAQAIYASIMQRSDLSTQQWVEVGVGLYNAENYGDAATAFGHARDGNPYNKEAMENYVNASVQAGRPGPVLALADTLVQWYPYDQANYQLLASVLARANMDDRAMEIMADGDATDVVFHFVQMAPTSDGAYVVQGSFETRSATGVLVIPFEFFDASGQVVHTEVLTTEAPAAGQPESFRLELQAEVPLAGFRYKKIGT